MPTKPVSPVAQRLNELRAEHDEGGADVCIECWSRALVEASSPAMQQPVMEYRGLLTVYLTLEEETGEMNERSLTLLCHMVHCAARAAAVLDTDEASSNVAGQLLLGTARLLDAERSWLILR